MPASHITQVHGVQGLQSTFDEGGGGGRSCIAMGLQGGLLNTSARAQRGCPEGSKCCHIEVSHSF
jgi:hypothetical protein